MSSYSKRRKAQELTNLYCLIAILASSAAVLQTIESPLQGILPWLKPGLANSLTLYAIIKLSAKAGIIVAIFRTLIASIMLGTFLSPVFFTSFSGSLAAATAMITIKKITGVNHLSIISISGAVASNLAQLYIIQLMFAGSISLWFHLSIMILVSIPSGIIVAKLTQELLRSTD